MRLSDCEVQHRVIRGHKVAFVFGAKRLTADELGSLAAEWVQMYGPVSLPGYASPEGWQEMAPKPADDPVAEKPQQKPDDAPQKAARKRAAKEA